MPLDLKNIANKNSCDCVAEVVYALTESEELALQIEHFILSELGPSWVSANSDFRIDRVKDKNKHVYYAVVGYFHYWPASLLSIPKSDEGQKGHRVDESSHQCQSL